MVIVLVSAWEALVRVFDVPQFFVARTQPSCRPGSERMGSHTDPHPVHDWLHSFVAMFVPLPLRCLFRL